MQKPKHYTETIDYRDPRMVDLVPLTTFSSADQQFIRSQCARGKVELFLVTMPWMKHGKVHVHKDVDLTRPSKKSSPAPTSDNINTILGAIAGSLKQLVDSQTAVEASLETIAKKIKVVCHHSHRNHVILTKLASEFKLEVDDVDGN